MRKIILHMWDAAWLAGSIQGPISKPTINSNSKNGSNDPYITTVYTDLKVYACDTPLVLREFRIPHVGFVAKAETDEGKIVVISFKGTDGQLDGINNLFTGYKKFADGSDVHMAFYTAAQLLFDEIKKDKILVEAIKNKTPIYLTGHSKGAAISTLVARMISLENPGTKLNVFTFGSPRVGGEEFATKYNNDRNIEHLRVESFGDIIPYLPLSPEEYKLPNSYTDIIIKDLVPGSTHEYNSVGKYYPVNIDYDNYKYNKYRIKPAPSKIGSTKSDLNAYYVAISGFKPAKMFGDIHGRYFPFYSENRRVSLR